MSPSYTTIIMLYCTTLRRISKGSGFSPSKNVVQMVHKTPTVHGISTDTIDNTLVLKLGGTNQGSTCSGVLWYYHIEPMLNALTQFSPGYQFTNVAHTNPLHPIYYSIYWWQLNPLPPSHWHTHEGIPSYCNHCTLILAKIWRHTGWDLSLSKCLFTLVTW